MKNWLIRNLSKVISNIMTLFSAIDDDLDDVAAAITNISEEEFLDHYNLESATTVMSGNSIVQTTSSLTATMTFSESNGNEVISLVIVPLTGDYNYTKTTTIVTGSNSETITSVYQKVAKVQSQQGD